jgi:hypothetical protein
MQKKKKKLNIMWISLCRLLEEDPRIKARRAQLTLEIEHLTRALADIRAVMTAGSTLPLNGRSMWDPVDVASSYPAISDAAATLAALPPVKKPASYNPHLRSYV